MHELKPEALWKHFKELSRIPRCSGNESAAAEYVMAFAEKMGLSYVSDDAGNVVVKKPGRGAAKNAAPVLLQAHLDMVCEKEHESDHDFSTDPVSLSVNGEWVSAMGTSLGADNGIGIAAALAILEDTECDHPPLEFLATVQEEVGLIGATELDASNVQARLLINLDGEEEGRIIVGCAGGTDIWGERIVNCYPPVMLDGTAYELRIGDLTGGHSGMDISKNRGNAIKILAHTLNALSRADSSLCLMRLSGGTRSNAIPRDAVAGFLTSLSEKQVEDLVDAERGAWKEVLDSIDPDLGMSIRKIEKEGLILTPESTERFVKALTGLPHGVMAIDPASDGAVKTSANLAVAEVSGGEARVLVSIRSSGAKDLELAADHAIAVMNLFGMAERRESSYPAWPRTHGSTLEKLALEVHDALFGEPAEAIVIHAGLECGILAERLPGTEAISIGPDLENPHSPDERVRIQSVERFYTFLEGLLARIANG